MRKRIFLLMLLCASSITSTASTVVWGGGGIVDHSNESYYTEIGYSNLMQWLWTVDDIYTKPNFFFTQEFTFNGITINGADVGWAAYGTHFEIMNRGDVIDGSSASGTSSALQDLRIAYGSSVILGFKTETWDTTSMEPAYGYGWVEIEAESAGLVVRNGAYGLEGQAMYAGGGAIPEPSSATLIMFGCSVLLLKRSRKFGGTPWNFSATRSLQFRTTRNAKLSSEAENNLEVHRKSEWVES